MSFERRHRETFGALVARESLESTSTMAVTNGKVAFEYNRLVVRVHGEDSYKIIPCPCHACLCDKTARHKVLPPPGH